MSIINPRASGDHYADFYQNHLVRRLCLGNRICRNLIPFCHCPHHCHDPPDNRPTKNEIDIEYGTGAFHMHPPRQDSRHEIDNSADNKQDPFGDFHWRDGPYCDSSFSVIHRGLSTTVDNIFDETHPMRFAVTDEEQVKRRRRTSSRIFGQLNRLARPEGFEPPTLRSEERLRHRLTRTHVEKKSETQAINAVSDLRHGLYSLPVPHSPVATW
jgi:hypothetical protein